MAIRVISALRTDAGVVAARQGYRIDFDSEIPFERPKKIFNRHRQTFYRATEIANPTNIELWIFVFPSAQYVEQVGELTQAIIDDYNRHGLASSSTAVTTWHFRGLEQTLTKWTGFDEAIKRFVRHGDVVAIGNLENFIPGLRDFGFEETRGWRMFGLEDMFGMKCFVHKQSRHRIVLVGFSECFWGEASAQYVLDIIEAGAKHILYGSKAASLLGLKTVHNMLAPTVFSVIESTDSREPEIVHVGTHYAELYSILDLYEIDRGQSAVTVPTVIGESNEQREIYENSGPGCLECENGHIARVISQYNHDLRELGGNADSFIRYVPIHFITDYIYKVDEIHDSKTAGLGSDPAEIEAQKNERFRTIGKFFATYTLMHGLKEHLALPVQTPVRSRSASQADDLFKEVCPLVDAGLGLEAISSLLDLHPRNAVPTNVLMATAMIAQKCGFLEFFESAAEDLSKRGRAGQLSTNDIFRRQVIQLKVLSQVGDFCGTIDLGERIRSHSSGELVGAVNQFGAVQRRLAVAYAGAGDARRSQEMMEEARRELPAQRADHYHETNDVFESIARLHLFNGDAAPPLDDVAGHLSDVRRRYLAQVHSDPDWWQLNLEKCAIASLFLEAAYFLDTGDSHDQEGGLKRLYAAHLLNGRIGGNECSETYGEIIAAIKSRKVRALIASAMQRDCDSPKPFQAFLRARHPSFTKKAREALELVRSAPLEREDAVQNFIGARL